MTYQRFEDLLIWKEAIWLAERVYVFTEDAAFGRQQSLRDQLERAAVSVSNNVAEGFERGTTQELLPFLYSARGSAGVQDSPIKGQRRLTEASRKRSEQKRRADDFTQMLKSKYKLAPFPNPPKGVATITKL